MYISREIPRGTREFMKTIEDLDANGRGDIANMLRQGARFHERTVGAKPTADSSDEEIEAYLAARRKSAPTPPPPIAPPAPPVAASAGQEAACSILAEVDRAIGPEFPRAHHSKHPESDAPLADDGEGESAGAQLVAMAFRSIDAANIQADVVELDK